MRREKMEQYQIITNDEASQIYGTGLALGFGLVATFGIVATISVLLYKIFRSREANITLPGGFKFEFENE